MILGTGRLATHIPYNHVGGRDDPTGTQNHQDHTDTALLSFLAVPPAVFDTMKQTDRETVRPSS